eukprot:363984-Chlamydomonas_euryale.AAC.10
MHVCVEGAVNTRVCVWGGRTHTWMGTCGEKAHARTCGVDTTLSVSSSSASISRGRSTACSSRASWTATPAQPRL